MTLRSFVNCRSLTDLGQTPSFREWILPKAAVGSLMASFACIIPQSLVYPSYNSATWFHSFRSLRTSRLFLWVKMHLNFKHKMSRFFTTSEVSTETLKWGLILQFSKDKHEKKSIIQTLMFLNCGAGEDSSESLGLEEDPTSLSLRKSVLNIGRTEAEAETPILWPPDVKDWLTRKDPDGGKDWRREEKGTTEDEMAGWHHRLNRHEFEQAPAVDDGQGSLACCSPWGRKELTITEWLNYII